MIRHALAVRRATRARPGRARAQVRAAPRRRRWSPRSRRPASARRSAEALLDFFAEKHNRDVVFDLLREVTPQDVVHETRASPVTGKTVVFTGKLETHLARRGQGAGRGARRQGRRLGLEEDRSRRRRRRCRIEAQQGRGTRHRGNRRGRLGGDRRGGAIAPLALARASQQKVADARGDDLPANAAAAARRAAADRAHGRRRHLARPGAGARQRSGAAYARGRGADQRGARARPQRRIEPSRLPDRRPPQLHRRYGSRRSPGSTARSPNCAQTRATTRRSSMRWTGSTGSSPRRSPSPASGVDLVRRDARAEAVRQVDTGRGQLLIDAIERVARRDEGDRGAAARAADQREPKRPSGG